MLRKRTRTRTRTIWQKVKDKYFERNRTKAGISKGKRKGVGRRRKNMTQFYSEVMTESTTRHL
jgi:hypothetical protein